LDLLTRKKIVQADWEQIEKEINKSLQTLHLNAGARFVVLVSTGGEAIQTVGQVDKFEAASVATLVAANFLAAQRLAEKLERKTISRSSSFEEDDQSIYTYNINGGFMLAVIFGKETRSGVVWVYTKQAAEGLLPLVEQIPDEMLNNDITLTLSIESSTTTQ
jgi:predicted regulator of Ras-like GTPase activity (Roadblock/LC7/MglB family)